jgi:hypothetical protein
MSASKKLYHWSYWIMGAFIFMWLSMVIIDWLSGSALAPAFYTEFTAGALGVFLGLLLGMAKDEQKREKRIPEVVRIVRQELLRMKMALYVQKSIPLIMDAWTALVNSGDTKILPSDIQESLFSVYAHAKGLDFEYRREQNALDCRDTDLYEDLSSTNRKRELSLQHEIGAVLQTEIFVESGEERQNSAQ